ncbi:MAG: hypothetical protein L0Y71_16470 [Gemmataceae bacterium]|nr:hypothetical protein [Gemmataceae bacterium]
MARRDDDDDDSGAYEEKPRRKPRPESIQPAQPRRPAPDDADDAEAPSRPRRRPPDDEDDDRPRRARRGDDEDDDDRPRRRKGGAIIPYRNGMALAAYYCGFGGLIFILGSLALGAVLAPNVSPALIFTLMYGGGGICALLAVIFGVAGLMKVNRDPEARGTAHAIVGIVLGSIEIIGLILIMLGVLAVAR